MATVADDDGFAVVEFGQTVFVIPGHLGKGNQTIGLSHQPGIEQQRCGVLHDRFHQLVENPEFDGVDFFFSAQNLFFVFFQFLRDIPLDVGERLFPDPVGRDFVLVHMGYFQIIAKDAVVGDFEG